MKKFVLAFAAAAAFAAAPSFALAAPGADPQTTVAVKAMFDAMEMRKNMGAMYAEMQRAMPSILRQQALGMVQADPRMTAAQKKDAVARIEKMVPVVAQSVSKVFNDPALLEDMINEMVPLYANNYTTAEINQLTAFYQTPVGRKMMTLAPKLSAEGMAVAQRVVTPRLGKLMQDVMQDVQKP